MLTSREYRGTLIRRAWTRAERRVVLHGFVGRSCIAIEPVLCGAVFVVLTIGMSIARTDPTRPGEHNLLILTPIFGFAVLACIAHAAAVMVAPASALFHSFRPIFIVDGYVRYRAPDMNSPVGSNGYAAVLNADLSTAFEWPTLGDIARTAHTRPALCQFSEFGGIHAIDGRSTGVLPGTIPGCGVGIASRRTDAPV
jgi:hypothetical protein